MAVKIRLRQQGANNGQVFRLVAIDGRAPRDGKYLEMLGSYMPLMATNNLKLYPDRIAYWLDRGAQLSAEARSLLSREAKEVLLQYETRCLAKRKKLAAKRRELSRRKGKMVKAK